ncbi:MAG: hypothetical protein EB116_20550, partial [Betaproteobacteria bacterium]|nr:hypothetical protein [Betaproteobacteria bacterium]
KAARQQLQALLLRLGNPYRGGKAWTLKHLKFLADIKFEIPAHRIAFTEYRLAVQAAGDRLERLNTAIRQESESWRWLPVVRQTVDVTARC